MPRACICSAQSLRDPQHPTFPPQPYPKPQERKLVQARGPGGLWREGGFLNSFSLPPYHASAQEQPLSGTPPPVLWHHCPSVALPGRLGKGPSWRPHMQLLLLTLEACECHCDFSTTRLSHTGPLQEVRSLSSSHRVTPTPMLGSHTCAQTARVPGCICTGEPRSSAYMCAQTPAGSSLSQHLQNTPGWNVC